MTHAEVLAELLSLGEVTSAAFFGPHGELLGALPGPLPDPALQGALTTFFASTHALADLLGAPLLQTTLTFGGGFALLTFWADGPVSVVTLSSVADLDRVRFSLQRLLPLLGSSSETPSGRD